MIRTLLDLAERFPLAGRYYGGMATIVALHRVAEPEPDRLSVNEEMKLSPAVLERFIQDLQSAGHRFISMETLWHHLVTGQPLQKCMVFTLDDGYVDNYTQAYPIFKKYGVPFTVYLTSSFPDQTAQMWWYALEDILCVRDELHLSADWHFDLSSRHQKNQAFLALRRLMLDPALAGQRSCMDALFKSHAVDWLTYNCLHALSWEQVNVLSADPLVTIGGHTARHVGLSGLSAPAMVQEVVGAHERIAAMTGRPVAHFAYPFGGRKDAGFREFSMLKALGLKTAVTTRRGNVFAQHSDHLTALPRVSLDNSLALRTLARPTFPRVVTA